MASLLWPEADAEAARSRLRRTLHKIRVAFTVDVIEADRTSLALAPSIEARIDAHAFEAACVAGELNEALRLYAGDFLQGLSIDGCAAFEEWAFFRREALRSRLVQALERLIERELVVGDARAAIAAATRLVGLDPLSESAQRHLINAYLRAGDRVAAERQYETCARLLKAELGVEPDSFQGVPKAGAGDRPIGTGGQAQMRILEFGCDRAEHVARDPNIAIRHD